jgi:hypothetical protein
VRFKKWPFFLSWNLIDLVSKLFLHLIFQMQILETE